MQGDSRSWVLLVLLGCSVLGPSRAHAENYAFLVAVQDYDVKDLKPLQFTRSDILEFAKVLEKSGFKADKMVVMTDKAEQRRYLSEAEKIRSEFELLLTGIKAGDTLVVAFSGHGVQFEGDPRNYFCPIDADLEDAKHSKLIALSEIYERLKECPAEKRLLVVDACRKEPLSAVKKARQTVQLKSVTRPQTEAVPKGVVAIFSCSAGQESYEWPDLKHGVFFYHVLEAWNGAATAGDRKITLNQVINYATDKTATFARVALRAPQVPHIKSDFEGTWVLRSLPPQRKISELLSFKEHTGAVWCVAFSPDGKHVASGQGNIYGAGEAGKPAEYTLLLWELETGKLVQRFSGHTETVRTVAFSPDGQRIVSGSWDKSIRTWDVKTGRQLQLFQGGTDKITGGITFSARGSYVFSGSVDKTAHWWDAQTGRLLKSIPTPGEVHCISLSPDGRLLVSGDVLVPKPERGKTVLSLWDLASGKLVRRYAGLNGMNTVSFSPDGRQLLSAGQGWSMQLWDVESGKQLHEFEGHACCFLPDGKHAFADARDQSLVLWDLESKQEAHRIKGHHAICVAVSRDGRRAISGGMDKIVRVWGLP